MKFEWDLAKAAVNLRKHNVSFEEATTVFGDPTAVTFSDTDHSATEDRSRTYGMSKQGDLLVVVHTERTTGIRIISARRATRYEQSIYTQN